MNPDLLQVVGRQLGPIWGKTERGIGSANGFSLPGGNIQLSNRRGAMVLMVEEFFPATEPYKVPYQLFDTRGQKGLQPTQLRLPDPTTSCWILTAPSIEDKHLAIGRPFYSRN